MTKRLLLLLVSLGFFSFLIADEENPAAGESAAEQVEAGDAEDDAEPEEVVVVGSRIARNEYDVAQPVTIIYGEEYDNRGYTNAADALFDVPGIGVTNSLTSGSGGNFGNQSTLSVGQSLANNFGLGSGRTLVLINGRRFVGSTSPFGSGGGGNAVDINNIPSQMIDRVEILNAGGSAIYGSDAIAGVINYVLKDNYEGSNASLVYDDYAGLSSDLSFQWVLGGNFADGKGNMVATFQYEDIGTVFTGDVDRYYNKETGMCGTGSFRNTYNSAAPYQTRYTAAGSPIFSDYGPEGTTEFGCVTLSAVPESGKASVYEYSLAGGYFGYWPYDGAFPDGTYWHFGGIGDLTPYDPGIYYGNAFFSYDGDDGYRGDFNTYRAGFERLNFSMFANYDVGENARLYFDVFQNRFFSFDYGNQSGYPYSTYAFGPGQDFPPFIGIDNPYLTQGSRDIMSQYGLTGVYVSKSHVDLLEKGDGGYTIENNNSVSFYAVGLEGEFAVGDNDFQYAMGYSIGNTFIYSDAPGVIGARYAAALDVGINPNTGAIDCKMNYDPDYSPALYDYVYGPAGPITGNTLYGPSLLGNPGDCAPLNIMGRGAPSQAAREYIGTNLRSNAQIEQELTYATLAGDLFEAPAGTVKAAVGFEGRVEQGYYNSSAIQDLALTRSAARPGLGGGYEVDASYYEVSVPLLGGDLSFPGMISLTADFSARSIDSTVSGSFDVEATSIAWRILDDLTVRASEQTAIKAPDLGDLFLPQVVTYSTGNDPCDYRNRGTGRNPDVREANCLAEGLAPDFVSTVVNATAEGVTGGNPNLFNETAETEAIGLVYQPSWFSDVLFGDLRFAVDYIKINLSDYVTSFSLTQNMEACYDFEDYPNQYCNKFQRDADGQVVYFESGLVNAGLTNFATYVWKADYAFDVAELASFVSRENVAMDLGSMAVRWRAYQEVYFETAASGDPDDLESYTGEFGNDEWFYDTAIEYSLGDWYAFVQGNSRSGGLIDKFQQYDDQYLDYNGDPIDRFRGYTIWNGGLGYNISDDLTLRVIANNLMDYDGTEEDVFDKEINFISIGRQVTASLNWRF